MPALVAVEVVATAVFRGAVGGEIADLQHILWLFSLIINDVRKIVGT